MGWPHLHRDGGKDRRDGGLEGGTQGERALPATETSRACAAGAAAPSRPDLVAPLPFRAGLAGNGRPVVESEPKEYQMNRTVLGIAAIVLSLVSAALAAFYWIGIVVATGPRPKHVLLFAVIFVILLLGGIIALRSRGRASGGAAAK